MLHLKHEDLVASSLDLTDFDLDGSWGVPGGRQLREQSPFSDTASWDHALPPWFQVVLHFSSPLSQYKPFIFPSPSSFLFCCYLGCDVY